MMATTVQCGSTWPLKVIRKKKARNPQNKKRMARAILPGFFFPPFHTARTITGNRNGPNTASWLSGYSHV